VVDSSVSPSLWVRFSKKSRSRLVVRLDDDVRERLERLSREEQLSLNHILNEALRQYAEWGSIYQHVGLAVIGKRLMHDMFELMSEEKAREFGRRNGREEAPLMVMSWFGAFNLENVLRLFGSILARYSGAFVFEHSREGRVHTVVIKHDMGRHASAYFGEYARAICELLNMRSAVSETDAQVLIRAEEGLTSLRDAARGLPSSLVQESLAPND
jgi:hypothetical protein